MNSSQPLTEGLAAPMSRTYYLGAFLCLFVPVLIWFLPLDLTPTVKRVFCVSSFLLIAWMFQVMEYALTGLIACFAFWALGTVSFPVAFSGFASNTAWFIFGAIIIGIIATQSGVSKRLSNLVMARVGFTYPRILLGLIITDFLLTFIIPSGTARVVIVASIAVGLIEALRMQKGSNVGRGMFLILTYTATIFDKMIIAGAASVTACGLIERIGGVDVLWSQWFVAFLPGSIITIFAAWQLTLRLWPAEPTAQVSSRDYLASLKVTSAWTAKEIRGAAFIAGTVGLWLTDFIHHVPPAEIAIGVGLLAFVPGIGALDSDELRKMNYLPVFFVATAMSFAAVLESTGALGVLTTSLFAEVEPYLTNSFLTTTVLYWAAFIYHFFLASEISMLATSMPVVMELAKANELSPLLIGMIWTFSAGGKIFVYQNAVLVVGYSYGYFRGKDLLRLGIWLTIIEFFVLLGLVTIYWPLIGIR